MRLLIRIAFELVSPLTRITTNSCHERFVLRHRFSDAVTLLQMASGAEARKYIRAVVAMPGIVFVNFLRGVKDTPIIGTRMIQ
jgi:hypothetical protein